MVVRHAPSVRGLQEPQLTVRGVAMNVEADTRNATRAYAERYGTECDDAYYYVVHGTTATTSDPTDHATYLVARSIREEDV